MTTTVDLLVVVPVLGRPHRAVPFLESLRAATPEPFTVRVVATRGDHAVQQAWTEALFERQLSGAVDVIPPNPVGDYAKKINHAYRTSDEPFIFCAADDLAFHPGWWEAARWWFEFRESVGVLGTNDLAPTERARRGEHSTHCVIRRSYVQQHGLIDGGDAVLYEGYIHEYVDDELVGTAKKRGAWCYDVNSVVEHLHPHWGKGPMDQTYRRSQARMARSRALFQQRSRLWK